MSDNLYSAQLQPMGGPPQKPTGFIKDKVKPPAIALMVVGGLSVLMGLWGLGNAALFTAGVHPQMAQQQEQIEQMKNQQGMDPQAAEMMDTWMSLMMAMQGPLGLVTNLVVLIVAAVIIFGAMKMMNLQSRGLAMTSAILAMLPCLSGCCILGLPFGIWAIVVLNDKEVKAAMK